MSFSLKYSLSYLLDLRFERFKYIFLKGETDVFSSS